MKIISWNVNGIRAIHKRGDFLPFIKTYKPDMLGIQETKCDEESLPDDLKTLNGYHAYFSASQLRKGYSGVGLYTKHEPLKVGHGIGIPEFDVEGRIVWGDFGDFILFNIYFPNGGQGPHRIEYKLKFYDAFLKHIENLRKKGKKIIFCGDVNTAHHEIDLARPKENANNTGFLPIERAWLDTLIEKGYVDVFRYKYPEKKEIYTYWDMKTRARDRNVGWRIDYFFVTPDLVSSIKDIKVLSEVGGSDHCPVMLELK